MSSSVIKNVISSASHCVIVENWFSASFQYHEEWLRQLLRCWSQVLTSIPYWACFQPQRATSPKGRDVP